MHSFGLNLGIRHLALYGLYLKRHIASLKHSFGCKLSPTYSLYYLKAPEHEYIVSKYS